MTDFSYHLTFTGGGGAVLTQGNERMWASDDDEEFMEEFDEVLDVEDRAEVLDVIAYLVEAGYVPPKVEVDVIDDTGEMFDEGDDEDYADEDDEDDEDYEDEDAEDDE